MGRYNWIHVINNNQIKGGVNLGGWQDGGHKEDCKEAMVGRDDQNTAFRCMKLSKNK